MDNTKITVFCANEQVETSHTVDIDDSGEVVLTCVTCGRFLKFPRGTTATDLKALLVAHKENSSDQISVASIEAEKASLLADLGTIGDAPADEVPVAPADQSTI
jgi:hypothetical protein